MTKSSGAKKLSATAQRAAVPFALFSALSSLPFLAIVSYSLSLSLSPSLHSLLDIQTHNIIPLPSRYRTCEARRRPALTGCFSDLSDLCSRELPHNMFMVISREG